MSDPEGMRERKGKEGAAPATQPGLEVRELRKEFPTAGDPLVVLDGLGLELPAGDTLSIVGPSGCGKSTLLHILGTLERPTSGHVMIQGTDPFGLSEPELARFRNRRVGFVFQDHHLLPQLTVSENVLVPSLAWSDAVDGATESVADRASRLLDRVGLGDRARHLPSELSGGERQRAAIARALILSPSLVLCDEPTGNLDRSTARRVGELLLEVHREEGTMLVVVTHSQELAGIFGHCAEMDRGRLQFTS